MRGRVLGKAARRYVSATKRELVHWFAVCACVLSKASDTVLFTLRDSPVTEIEWPTSGIRLRTMNYVKNQTNVFRFGEFNVNFLSTVN